MNQTDGTTGLSGSCLCGSVRITLDAIDRQVVYCHCSQCRKQTGHYYAALRCRDDQLHISGEEHLRWYAASAQARRGFCRECGSALFWKEVGSENTSILAGCLDSPTHLRASAHIFVDDKGDYYTITDGLKQHPQAD